jgi:hypothetical protein
MPLTTWQAKRKAQTTADRSHDSDEDGSNDSTMTSPDIIAEDVEPLE